MDNSESECRNALSIQMTRRTFVTAGLATGFALAVMPVSAENIIRTDTNGLVAGEVQIPVKDGEICAYRAMPAAGEHFATVLVVHEVFGVHEHIKDICRRLAKLGYFAVAPCLFSRQGDVVSIPNLQDVMKIVAKVPDSQVAADLDSTVAWARSTGKAETDRLGITGFCWGGRQVWLYAAHNPKLKAGVAWYGPLNRPTTAVTPQNPIELVDKMNAPILGLYGGADAGIPVTQIEAMQAAIKAAWKQSEIITYPNTPHAFYADYRPSYRPAQAADGWQRMKAWFRKYGVV